MPRMLLALVAGVAAAGCGASSAPPRQAPLANAAGVPPDGSPCELGWLSRTERLIVTERSDGPFGSFAFRAELGGPGRQFTGLARGEYRRFPESPLRPMVAELRVSRGHLRYVLDGISRGAWIPAAKVPGGRLVATDTSESRSIRLEAEARVGGGVRRARLETDRGQDDPHSWTVVGCERALSHEAQVRITQEYARIDVLVRRTQTLIDLRTRTP